MHHVLDDDDERAILAALQRNRDKAASIGQACARARQRQQAAAWARLATAASEKLALLAGAFARKN